MIEINITNQKKYIKNIKYIKHIKNIKYIKFYRENNFISFQAIALYPIFGIFILLGVNKNNTVDNQPTFHSSKC